MDFKNFSEHFQSEFVKQDLFCLESVENKRKKQESNLSKFQDKFDSHSRRYLTDFQNLRKIFTASDIHLCRSNKTKVLQSSQEAPQKYAALNWNGVKIDQRRHQTSSLKSKQT